MNQANCGRIGARTLVRPPAVLGRPERGGLKSALFNSMAGLSGFLPARASRGEGVANAVSWWWYQDPEATCRRALNFLLALSSNRRDAQNDQIKSGPGSFDASKSKNGCRSSATPCSQPRSPGPQAQGTAPALHSGCKFSACAFGYRADAGVRRAGGPFAPAGLENTLSGASV